MGQSKAIMAGSIATVARSWTEGGTTMSDLISRSALMKFALNHVGGTIDCNDIERFHDEPVARNGRVKCDFCGRGKPIKAYTYLPDCGLQYGATIEAVYCPKCGTKMD